MADQPLRLAYLTSQYPATSHTFIRREIEAVRALGVYLETFSIRPPSASELQDPAIRAESHATFTALRQPLTTFLAAHLATLATEPLAYLRTLGRALSHRPPGIRALALSIAHFGESIVLGRELRRRKISRLHNHFANSGATVGMLAAELAHIPWSFTMHGISETDYPAGLLLSRKIQAADFVACVSYFGRAQAMRVTMPKQWSKLHVIRCGVPPTSNMKRHSGNRTQIMSVGRLSPEKGLPGLLQAFAAVTGAGVDADLVLVGDGPDGGALSALCPRTEDRRPRDVCRSEQRAGNARPNCRSRHSGSVELHGRIADRAHGSDGLRHPRHRKPCCRDSGAGSGRRNRLALRALELGRTSAVSAATDQ
jgi:Glycosyltransferase